ncbi:MAG: glycosyltransferase [Beijerinckiaceae bacterium]
MTQHASARDGATRAQRLFLAAFCLAVGGAFLVAVNPLSVAALLLSPLYLLHMLFALGAALERPAAAEISSGPAAELPVYTLLVPLYGEARIVPQMIAVLMALEYPRDRLQVLLLVEADDAETAAAIRSEELPPHIEMIVVPPGGPRTKPNALNHGLSLAHGQLITVFDAEDIPDPAQLRHAVAAFSTLPPDVVCLQARLVIDNAADGWLALMMTIEYAALFDATKCGFAAMKLPVALGGSSNHLRMEPLRRLGGWDAWNVTEDADLGLRIARAGWLVADLPTVTLEEAPFSLSSWFRQRRRWQKGFMQTFVSYSRAPRQAIRAMGLVSWLAGMAQVAGAVLGALLFPIFAAHVIWLATTGALFENASLAAAIQNTATLWVACCGVMSVLAPALIGLRRRRLWHLAPWLLMLPLYQLLVSAAAWVAIVDYLRAPFAWLKTEHGCGVRGLAALRSRTESR